jgi:hypothetical protein
MIHLGHHPRSFWGYDQSTAIEDPTNRNRDYGNSVINRPNAFTMSAVFMPTHKPVSSVVDW